MKVSRKLDEPPSLAAYREAQPEGTWDQMRDDPHHGGQRAYVEVKQTLVRGQRCLCAYCEIRIAEGTSTGEIEASKNLQRVEHFHPKDDLTRPPNWALHWPNLWAVCLGGSKKPPEGEPLDPQHFLPPLPENLSCDAFKDYQIRKKQLDENPEGWILAPDEVPAFPRLFQYAPNGTPEPCSTNCVHYVASNNHHDDTATLVFRTIQHLNLGCPRLNRTRCIAKAQLEKVIAQYRKNNPGANAQMILLRLARRMFSNDPETPWGEFFTLIRWRLGEAAEEHLRAIGFAG